MAFEINLGNLVVNLVGDSSKFIKMIDQAQAKMLRASKKLAAAGRRMTRSITLPLLAIGAVSIKVFADFDDAMTKSTSIMSNMTDSIRRDMEEQARSISREGVTSAAALAESYFFLASAGLNAEQSIQALGAVEKFAVAGAFDMAKATDLLTDAQSALGLVMEDSQENLRNMVGLSDVLLKANTLANASAQQFSEALVTKSAAALRLLNKDVIEGVAVLAAFADQGIKGAIAGEKLSIVLRDLQSSTLKNSKTWKEFGLRVFDVKGQMLPLADIIEDLETKFGSMTDKQKKAAAMMLGFQERSFSAIQTLFGTSEKIREYERQLRQAGGTTEDVANKQIKSFSSQMLILKNNVFDVAITVGRILTPTITKLANWVKEAARWFRGLSEDTQLYITMAIGAVAALGPLLLIFGAIAGAIGAISAVGLGTIAIVAAIAIAAVAFAAALTTAFDSFLDMLGLANLGIVEFLQDFRIGGNKISTWAEIAWVNILKGWEFLTFKLAEGWEKFKILIRESIPAIQGWFFDMSKKVVSIFLNMFRIIGTQAINALPALSGLRDNLLASFEVGIVIAEQDAFTLLNKAELDAHRASEGALEDHQGTLEDLQADHVDRMFALNDRLAVLDDRLPGVGVPGFGFGFGEDEKEKEGGLVDNAKKAAKKALDFLKSKIPVLPEFKFPDIVQPKAAKVAEAAIERDQQFQVINLKRFSLEGPGGLSRKPPTQEVEDKGVMGKIDELIDVTKTRSTVAVLG